MQALNVAVLGAGGTIAPAIVRDLARSGDEVPRLALLGIGSSPGKTNLMARHALDALGGAPESIDVAAAGRDPAAADGSFRPPYAIQTLLDELTLEPVVLREGQPTEIEPLTDGGT